MGQTLKLETGGVSRKLMVEVIGTDKIDTIAVVKKGKEVYRKEYNSDYAVLVWEDDGKLETSVYYYVRIEQADGHLGWTSPVWVEV